MRVGFIGDVHLDYNVHHDFRSAFARVCCQEELDVLIFCGDTSIGPYAALGFYEALQNTVLTRILEIPGNHEQSCPSSGSRWEIVTAAEENYQLLLHHKQFSLYENPLITKNWAIIGNTGWFDGSFRECPGRRAALPTEFCKVWECWPGRVSSALPEKEKILTAAVRTGRCLRELDNQLRQVREAPGGMERRICAVSHVLPIRDMYQHAKFPLRHCVSVMGSERIGKLYEEYGVDLGICGHSHLRTKIMKNGVRYVNVSLGHNVQWVNKTDAVNEIQRTLYVLEC